MKEIVGSYFLLNGKTQIASGFDDHYKDHYVNVYEVIRMINGALMFLDDHLDRLYNSLKVSACDLPFSREEVVEMTRKLYSLNDFKDGNIKLIFSFSKQNRSFQESQIFFSKTSYPESDLYIRGIEVHPFRAERLNPNAKVYNVDLRTQIAEYRKKHNLREVLLVDRNKCITEGSMSNAFFLRDGKVITAPDHLVLVGITRKYVLKACELLKIPVIEKALSLDELSNVQAAFISGTSPKVLPIHHVGHYKMNVNNRNLRKLMEVYDQLMCENLSSLS
jgi:branched-chain amino acid aminotransferase